MTVITVVTVVAYFVLVLTIGAKAASFIKNADDYMIAGGNLGFLAFMILIVGTVMSGMTVLGASGLAFVSGWPSMWEPIFVCLSVPILMIVFGAKMHRISKKHGYRTVQDYLAHRYQSPKVVRGIAGIAGIVMSFIYLVGQLNAITIVLAWLFKLSDIYALLLGTVVISIYVMLGGLYAIAYTALIQGLTLLLGSVVIVPFVLRAAGGFTYINQRLAEINPNLVALAYPQVHPPVLPKVEFLTPLYLVSFFFLLAFGLAAAPHALNNILAAKKNSYYKWAPLTAFVIYIVAFYFIKFAGLSARVMVADGVLEVPKPDYAIIAAIEHSLSPFAWSVFAVIVLSAVMSTTDRLLLTIGTLFSWDVYKNLIKPDLSDRSVQRISRLAVLIASALAFLLAIKPPELLAFLIWMGIGLMLATYCVPLLAGLYWKRANREGAIASMIVGLVVAVIAGYIHQYVAILPVHFSFIAFVASAIAMIVVSLLTPKPSEQTLQETATGLNL